MMRDRVMTYPFFFRRVMGFFFFIFIFFISLIRVCIYDI